MPSILIPDDEPPTPSPRLQRLSRRKQEFDEPDLVAIGVQQEVVIEEKEEAPSLPQATPDADSFIKNPFSKNAPLRILRTTRMLFHTTQVSVILTSS